MGGEPVTGSTHPQSAREEEGNAPNAQTQYAYAPAGSRGYRLNATLKMIAAMEEAGASTELILASVKAMLSAPTSAAVRQARYRDNKRNSDVTLRNVTDGDVTSVTPPSPLAPLDKEIPPTPPKEINPPLTPQPRKNAGEFDEWYSRYPNKVGRADAAKAFDKARAKVPFQSLADGLTRYLAKADDRPWCNPATWLNQERWADEPAQVARGSPGPRTAADVLMNLSEQMENAKNVQEPSRSDFVPPSQLPRLTQRPDAGSESLPDGGGELFRRGGVQGR